MFFDILAENIEYEVADKFSTSANGTSYQSEITTTYDRLETLFGTPTYTDADPYEKVSCEWVLDGKVYYTDEYGEKDWEYITATIYAWKYGRIPTEECAWNIGGKSYDAVEFVNEIISGQIEPEYNYAESA